MPESYTWPLNCLGVPHLPQQGSKALYQHGLAAAVVVRQQEEIPERQHPRQRLRARTDICSITLQLTLSPLLPTLYLAQPVGFRPVTLWR